jgi:hypothetical protein
LLVHSIRWRALLQMRQNGLDRVLIGDICDHPQRTVGQRTGGDIYPSTLFEYSSVPF